MRPWRGRLGPLIAALAGISAVLIAAAPVAALAGEAATLEVIGFSPDGQYFAFEQYGVIDGGPTAFSEIHVIEVTDNAYAVPVQRRHRDEAGADTLAALRAGNRAAAAATLTRLGLDAPQPGRLLVHRPLTDLDAAAHAARFAATAPLHGLPAPAHYRLVLDSRPAPQVDCHGLGTGRALTLRLEHADASRVLQHEAGLPPSRGCVFGYRIHGVWLHGDHLAVLLALSVPGFEGESLRYRAVTGRLGN